MATEWATRCEPYILYDGTNSAEIAEALETTRPGSVATIISQIDGALTINIGETGQPQDAYVIQEGYRFGPTTGGHISPTEWATRYVKV